MERPQAVAPVLTRADSQEVRAAARAAQHEFERVRRNELPWTWSGGSTPCDEVIGRFCLWHDGSDDWEPPPEPARVGHARARFVAELEAASARLPGDPWIAGHLVRYLVEAARAEAAGSAARTCGAEPWWCAALQGYARHHAGAFEAADSAFAAALRAMPAGERERWRDLVLLLESGARGRYRRLSDAERSAYEERFWRLADPLYLVPGNERRTEHYARHVLTLLQQDARSPFGVPWGADLREIVIRYGWPAAWERVRPPAGSAADVVSAVSHFARGGRRFAPPGAFLDDPVRIGPEDWPLDPPRPRSEFAAPYASAFEALEHQLAVFRRRDSVVVVGAYDVRTPDGGVPQPVADSEAEGPLGHGSTAGWQTHAALVLVGRDGIVRAATHAVGRQSTGVLSAAAPADSMLVSLEVLAQEARWAARARYGLPVTLVPALVPVISDVLLLERPESLPATLAAAAAGARGSTRVSSGERIGIFFEIYGLPARSQLATLAVSVAPAGESWLRRAARVLGLAGRDTSLVLSWTEEVSGATGPVARVLAVDLPELSPGRQRLRLTVTLPGRTPMSAVRTLEVRPAPSRPGAPVR